MAIAIDPATSVITVPQGDLAHLSGTLYSADSNQIRKDVMAILASEEYIWMADAFSHNTTVTLFGVTYARTLEYVTPYSIEFTPDAQWSVRLEGSNNNMGDVEAGILVQNQVQVIPTNSAGLIDLEILTSSAYQGKVVVSQTRGQAGTSKPIGTFERPSNNTDDALVIAMNEGLPEFLFTETMTVADGDFSLGYNFVGTSPNNVITLAEPADVTNCNFSNVTLVGELDGLNLVERCSIGTVTKLSGFIEKSALQATSTLSGTTFFAECYSQAPGMGYPTISTGAEVIMVRDHHGSLGIDGMTSGVHTIEIYGGRMVIEAGCTGGTIYYRGSQFQDIEDNSGGAVTLIDQTDAGRITNKVWEELIVNQSDPAKIGGFIVKRLLTKSFWLGNK